MSPRVACAIPGCGDTRRQRKEDRGVPPAAWICGAHWSLVPEAARAEYRRLQRLERRAAAQHGVPYQALTERADAAWAACVAAATALRCEAA